MLKNVEPFLVVGGYSESDRWVESEGDNKCKDGLRCLEVADLDLGGGEEWWGMVGDLGEFKGNGTKHGRHEKRAFRSLFRRGESEN